MSPHLRSMLEDAADDSGRPVTLDLEGIRATGRRAVWRQRGIVGALGVGVTAVIATVAVTIGSGGIGQTEVAPSASTLEAAGLSASAGPLIAAIEAAGYDVDLGDAEGHGVGEGAASAGGAGYVGGASGATFPITRDGTAGTLRLAEFTNLEMLTGLVSDPNSSTPDAARDATCAVPPPVTAEARFRWGACAVESLGDGELRSTEGGGDGVEAVGATVILADGTGFSATLTTAPVDDAWFTGDEPLPGSPLPSLAALPLTVGELAEVMTDIAAEGGSLLSTEPSPADPSSAPIDAPSDATTAPVESPVESDLPPDSSEPSVDPAATHPGPAEVPVFQFRCPDGDVLADLSDDLGAVSLVESEGTTYVCLPGVNPVEDEDAVALTGWDWPTGQPLEAWRFRLGYVTMCIDPCTDDVWSGVGPVPPGVARITFETPDGEVNDAQIAGGYWIFRHPLPIGSVVDAPLVTVRLYDAAGALLLEGDTRDDGA